MRLILVRHGQTHSNVTHSLDTEHPGASLTDLGRAQADAIPEALAGESVDSISVSNLLRTHETAAPLAQARGLEPVVRDGLREIAAGEFEMRNDEASIRSYLGYVVKWFEDPHHRMPGGETGAEVLARYDGAIADIEAEGSQVPVVVSHGAIIVMWAAARAALPEQFYGRSISNTGVAVVNGSPTRGWSIERWEEHALGGAAVDDTMHDGPTGVPDPVHQLGLELGDAESDS